MSDNMPAPAPMRHASSLMDRVNIAVHVRRYFKLIARRWWIILIFLGSGAGYSGYKAHTTPNTYRAYSRLEFPPKVGNIEGQKQAEVRDAGVNLENYFDTEIQRMVSSGVIAKAREKMRDYKSPAGVMPGETHTAARGPGTTFVLTVESTEFDYARQFASNWARAFVAFKDERRNKAIEEKTGNIRQELLLTEQKYERARHDVIEFQKRNKIGGAQDARTATQEQLNRLKSELSDIITLHKKLELYNNVELATGRLADKGKDEPKNPANPGTEAPAKARFTDPLAPFKESNYNDLSLQLRVLEEENQKYSVTLKPRHPAVIALTAQIAKVKRDMQFQLDKIEEKRLAEIEKLRKDEAAYQPLIAQAEQEVFAKTQILFEFKKLEEEESSLKRQTDILRDSLRTLENTPTNEENIVPTDEGVGNPAPVAPNRLEMVLKGMFVGLAASLGIIYLLNRLDDRLELAEDIEAELEEPILGQIPLIDKSALQNGRLLITKLDQHNMFAESIRGVRSALLFGSRGVTRKVLLITSAVPGDGKTTFTVNFAATLANAGHKVLLVDADMRRGNTHSYFDHPREPGLAEILQGELHWKDAVRETEIRTLQVINSGKFPSNPGELLLSPVAKEFIDDAKQSHDYILFDCPPLTAIDDTFCLLGSSDGLIFVVKAGQTSMRFAKNALAIIRQRGADVVGVVLNGISGDNPYYYYNYYYHAYYNTGQSKADASENTPIQPATKMAPRRKKSPNAGAAIQPASSPDEKKS